MTWVKLDDTCPDHPALVGLSDAAFACWVRGLCYSSRHLTDGLIPTAALRGIGTAKAAAELAAAGRWVVTGEGWRVHAYEDHQRTRAQVDAERDAARVRQSRHRTVTPTSRRDKAVSHAEVTRPEVEVEVEAEVDTDQGQGLLVAVPTTDIAIPDRFDEFWSAYPKKADKPQARKAWAAALKRATPDEIIAGAIRYANDPNREPQFTKNAQGWLSGERWTYIPEPPRAKVDKHFAAAAAWAERKRAQT